jgi:predicted permease
VIEWHSFWPSFFVALVGTAKVFAIGSAGFILVRRGWLPVDGLQALGQLVAYLTLPCLIFYRIATRFFGLLMGKLVALRHGNNDEATMLIGFQNAGFFVLPMLQALLPTRDYERASLLLFMLIIPFNASLWIAGSWLLLKRRDFEWQTLFTPPFVATIASLFIYGLFHDWMHRWDSTLLVQVLFGGVHSGGATGAIQQIGDLTVPLATVTLGGSIAANVRGRMEHKRAVTETVLMKLIILPLLGYFVLLYWLGRDDYTVWLLLMLQFASPPAVALAVFAQQHGFPMRLIPAACLLSYIACLVTVPFFIALVPR